MSISRATGETGSRGVAARVARGGIRRVDGALSSPARGESTAVDRLGVTARAIAGDSGMPGVAAAGTRSAVPGLPIIAPGLVTGSPGVAAGAVATARGDAGGVAKPTAGLDGVAGAPTGSEAHARGELAAAPTCTVRGGLLPLTQSVKGLVEDSSPRPHASLASSTAAGVAAYAK
jgi:hypothetical protein